MREIIERHKSLWAQRSFIVQVGGSILLLVFGIFTTYFANIYTTIRASNAVTDIILDNIPTVNVNFVFTDGATIFVIFVAAVLLYDPKRIPFAVKSIALFIVIRSAFVTLTHLAPPLGGSYVDSTDVLYRVSSGDDLFFSGHTGLPFLLAIILWDHKPLRYIFFALTLISGTSVLLGHLHYSIDVFSALFISFGIFHIARYLFPEDYNLLHRPPRAS
jgi:hypothetical protein